MGGGGQRLRKATDSVSMGTEHQNKSQGASLFSAHNEPLIAEGQAC